VAYNGLQLIAYFITVFIAAPLALITGLGMSPALSTRFTRISKVFSIQTARSVHFLVLVWFLIFIMLHVTFVFTTGLLVNLNHVREVSRTLRGDFIIVLAGGATVTSSESYRDKVRTQLARFMIR
jgi:thiosulfate reductase cytochrome b subunit